jgi:hypothetical protein
MRNPINSILATNLKLRESTKVILIQIARLKMFEQKMFEHDLTEMLEICDVQESSTKLLNFYVGDLLSMAQINKGAFRKNIERFDVS